MNTHRSLHHLFGFVSVVILLIVGRWVNAGINYSPGVVSYVRDAANNDVTGGTLPLGAVVHDEATVTRGTAPPGYPEPTGTVTFFLFDNGTCNGNVLATDIKALVNGTATSETFTTPPAGGTFSYSAHYNGDGLYLQQSGLCEPFSASISHADVVTQVHDASHNDVTGGSLQPGAIVHDQASVTRASGTPAGVPDPTGTITFNFFSNGACTGVPIFTETLPLPANGTAESSTFTLSAGGSYSFQARYNGDANYTFADGACESISAAANQASVTTKVRDAANNEVTAVQAGTVVHDEATVAKASGTPAAVPDPTGSVDFTLYGNGTCNGTVIATDPGKPLASGTATSATFTTPAAGGVFSYRAHYGGDANYQSADGPCEAFTAQTGRVTVSNVECSDVLGGAAPTLSQVNYSVFAGKIAINVTPGVFFFWTKVTTTVPNQVVTVTQTNTSTNNTALFAVAQAWDRVYTGTCSTWRPGTLTAGASGASFTVPLPGAYFIVIKYQTKSIAGTAPPVPANINYNFATSLGGGTGASVLLKKN